MAPSIIRLENGYHQSVAIGRTHRAEFNSDPDTEKPVTVPPHPLDVKPIGNSYTASYNLRDTSGGLFASLTDDLIIQTFEFLDAISLLRIGSTCKALYAFARFDDLWKTLFIQKSYSPFTWRGSWRRTYFDIQSQWESLVSCSGLYSDLLYRPYFCAHTPLLPYTENIPARNSIPRLDNISQEEFSRRWVDKPFILTSVVKDWPVFKHWSLSALASEYGNLIFRAEAVDWPFLAYKEYMDHCEDESPIYLFDRAFVEKMALKVGSKGEQEAMYWVPDCFGEDFFRVLGDERPDNRWLIIGPERSGSTFHKDPNATSAWNAVIRGAKYWIMFPQSEHMPPPPGVYVSEDQSEVTSPLSIAEWLLGFHAEARKTKGCLEGICGEGEVLHVPSGWWHLVVNLTPAIAITQNFIPQEHLTAALLFLRDRPEQVSGFEGTVKDPYSLFVQRMKEAYPTLLEKAFTDISEKENAAKSKRKRKWHELVHDGGEKDTGGFSFGFAEEQD